MKTTTLLTLGASLALAASASAVTIFTENFDSLTAASALNGQGGWSQLGGSTNNTVEVDPGSFGFSGNIVQGPADSQSKKTLVTTMNDTDLVTLQFDMRINGDASYSYVGIGSSSALALSFGVERGNLTLRSYSGTQTLDHNLTGDNVYHMVMSIDPTANGGAGSATATYALYTSETVTDAPVVAFSNVNLGMSAGNHLSDMTDVGIRLHSDTNDPSRIDNISITTVPEPSSAALLGLGGLALILRRRK